MVGYVVRQSSPNKLFHLNFVEIPVTGFPFLVVNQLTSGFKILNSLSALLMEIIESSLVELIHLLLRSCSDVNVGKKKESRGSLPDLHLHIADSNMQEQEFIQTVWCISTWQHVILWIYKTNNLQNSTHLLVFSDQISNTKINLSTKFLVMATFTSAPPSR